MLKGLCNWRRWNGIFGVVCILAFVNVVMFLPHYMGKATFPWDFLAGYHAQTFAWIAHPGATFPVWSPWSDLGFPSFLALQDGAAYLPFVFLKLAGIQYSVELATAIQASHALLGSLGMFALARVMGVPVLPSLLAALGYQLGAGFYSNQQHSDIIRAAAILPWLLFSFHPRVILGRWWWLVFSALCLFQFLVAAYPGNIVAAVYTSFVFVCINLIFQKHKLHYFLAVIAVVVGGVMMSLVKWLPLIMNSGYLERTDVTVLPIEPIFLLTAVLPYDMEFLPSDLSMRSLWLPLVAIWGVVYCDFRSVAGLTGAAMAALALLVAVIFPFFGMPQDFLPGGGVSRFLLSDWRPTLHIGVLILSVSGWWRLLTGDIGVRAFLVGTAVGGCAVLLLFVVGLRVGYPVLDLSRPLLVLGGMTATLLLVESADKSQASTSYRAIALSLGLLIVFDGAMYQLGQTRAWRISWDKMTEVMTFGDLIQERTPVTGLETGRRPERYLLDAEPDKAIKGAKNTAYNKCWYESRYCVFGYNNLKFSPSHQLFAKAVLEEGGRELLDFMRRPQQLYVATHGDRVLGLDPTTREQLISGGSGVDVSLMEYGATSLKYEISATKPVTIIENEIWWPGWSAMLCDGGGDCRPIEVASTSQALRTWNVPSGEWTVVLEYRDVPRWKLVLVFLFGLGFIIMTSVISSIRSSGN